MAAFAASVAASTGLSQETRYPLTLENCGQELIFDAAPETTVTVGQSTTEILYLLGLGNHVAATSVWFNPVLPEFEGLNARIDRLSDDDPSFESILEEQPDLVTVMHDWLVGEDGIVATREMFHDADVPTYVMPTDCEEQDSPGGEDAFTPDQLYRGIEELANIYDAREEGAALIADLQAREASAVAGVEALNLPEGTSAIVWFSSADIYAAPYVAGQQGVPAYMMDRLGIENIVQSDRKWPTLDWEDIALADPSVIILAEMNRRRFAADDIERKLEFLMTDPVTRKMTAVREGRIIIIDAHALSPTVRAIYALEEIVNALAEFDLSE
ncbi:ABC transporter substrate-binding protein [Rhodophyticola sp. CCM32]|uniref:ABC transporter substrate-binding protein n=1 Tax=Rhodophyticola sp. CCM32 TaxID=2916397 RepID=UPI001EE4EBDA|nr:ABC transporter substrate-binding protein [Rhodophyticola sp. CCM32]